MEREGVGMMSGSQVLKWIKKKKREEKKKRNTNLVITRGKGGAGRVEEVKGGINGDGRRHDLGW